MRRRGEESVDPLDLLLDTVCNLFGVIIFIAMFAAILVKPGLRTPPSMPADDRTTALSVLDEEDDTKIQVIEIDDPEVAKLDERIAEAEREVESRRRMIRRLEDAVQQARRVDEMGADSLSAMQEEVDSLERRIEATESISVVPMRTPRQGEQAEGIPTAVYVHAGKVYIPNDYRGWGAEEDPESMWWKYMGPGRFNGEMTSRSGSTATRLQDGRVRRRLKLLPSGGIPAADPLMLREDPRWRTQIASLIPGRHIVYVTVTPDSFAEFGVVRSELARLGISYDVFIQVENSPVIEETWIVGTPTSQ